MRNYDWGFAPNPRQGYFPAMWPVDREATFGFGGTGAPGPGGGRGGAADRNPYDADFGARGYDAGMRRVRPELRSQPVQTLHPRGDRDRVTFQGGRGGGYGGYGADAYGPPRGYGGEYRGAGRYDGGFGRGEYGEAYPGFGGYPGARGGMYGGWDRQDLGARGFGRGYDRGMGRGGMGGGKPFAGAPFIPEEAYRRHPELMAEPHHHDAGYGEPAGMEMELDDGDIYQAVCQRLRQDRYLDADQIHLMVNDGVVTLAGEVDDFMEARYAWDDAWETPGVRGVVNHLAVRTDQPHVSHNDEMPQSTSGDATA